MSQKEIVVVQLRYDGCLMEMREVGLKDFEKGKLIGFGFGLDMGVKKGKS